MANPRLAVDFEGIDGHYTGYVIDASTITFSATAARGSAVVDRAVSLSGAGIVKLAADGERVIGRLDRVENDGICTVQDGGHTTLPGGTGATLTNGTAFVGALNGGNPGYIRSAAATGAAYAEAAADDQANANSNQIIDSATATAVKVRLNR
jgi:hypothetical protein